MPRKKGNNIRKNQDQWVFLLPDQVMTDDSQNKKGETAIVKLKHPKSGQSAMFLFASDNTQLYELIKFVEDYRSWFINDTVQQDGSLYMATLIDPLFLTLPYVMNATKESGMFMRLDQILHDPDFPHTFRLHHCSGLTLSHLNLIFDVKGGEEMRACRYNHEKTLSWLGSKVGQTADKLEGMNIHVAGGAQSATYIRSNKTSGATRVDFMRYAHGLVSDYISQELGQDLYSFLSLPDVKTENPSTEPPLKRVKGDSFDPVEDYSKFETQIKDDNKKLLKMTAGQKALSKVDKTGMKNIASFFSTNKPAKKSGKK